MLVAESQTVGADRDVRISHTIIILHLYFSGKSGAIVPGELCRVLV